MDILLWVVVVGSIIAFLIAYLVYAFKIKPWIQFYKKAKILRSILAKTNLRDYKFNKDGLNALRSDSIRLFGDKLTDEERTLLNDLSVDTFFKIGKLIKRD